MRSQADPERDSFTLAITLTETGELIGSSGLTIESRAHRRGEIGYALRPDHWKHGHGSEAARLLIAYGFGSVGLHRIEATCEPANIGSARVMEKAGLVREGYLRDHFFVRGSWRDSVLYAIVSPR